MHRHSVFVVLSSAFCTALLLGGCGSGALHRVEHDPFAGFLKAFHDATGELDEARMQDLFLLPDETADGIDRKTHLEEMSKDWTRARARGEAIVVNMTEVKYLIRTVMLFGDEERAEREIVEFQVVPTAEGWKIVRMDYISK